MNPRPWFLSLTAIWSDEPAPLGRLQATLTRLLEGRPFPYHLANIPHTSWHLTVFAILRINALPPGATSFREYSRSLLHRFAKKAELVVHLGRSFADGISLQAHELRIFDNGAAVQFRGDHHLSRLRKEARDLLAPQVAGIVDAYPPGALQDLTTDPTKNSGEHAYGSVARSPSRSDLPVERYRVPIAPVIPFTFRRIHLLTSDEALTNPREPEVEDFIIGR